MKVSTNTLNILKNMAAINPNLVVKAGDVIQSIAITKSVLVTAKVSETFPDFAIYDLSEFLGVMSLFKEPELLFGQDRVTLAEGRNKVTYMFGDKSVFKVQPPDKELKMPDAEVEFDISSADISSLIKAANVLKLGEIAVTNKGTTTPIVKVLDAKSPLTNSFSIDLEGAKVKGEFTLVFKVDNLKVISGDYNVKISSKKIALFTNKDIDVTYHIALEATSSEYSE